MARQPLRRRSRAVRYRTVAVLVATATLALRPIYASPASFDCGKAATAIEKMICADGALSKLDEDVAAAYRTVLPLDPEWRSRQHVWLTQERNRCADVSCLKKAYQQRLTFLETSARSAPAAGRASDEPPLAAPSFERPPYIHPLIVEALTTWLSDRGDQVVAINLTDSQHSNRFYGATQIRKTTGTNPYVYVERKNEQTKAYEGEFGYVYLGCTTSGIHVLRTSDSGGGSGVFEELLFVTFESDLAMEADGGVLKKKRPRLLLKAVGQYGLGDRSGTTVKLDGDDLVISEPNGAHRTIKVP